MDPVLAWPPRLTAEQIEEARTCDTSLPPVEAPATGCELARAAQDCMVLADVAAREPCIERYRQAAQANPLLPLMGALPPMFFDQTGIVAPIVPADARVVALHVVYGWTGLGKSVAWTLDVVNGEKLTAKARGARFRAPDDLADRLAALPAATADFLPVPHAVRAIDCYDDYPMWSATITLADGRELRFDTHGSNLVAGGGPWQTTIDGQSYVQVQPGLALAIGSLAFAGGLPLGLPEGTYCPGRSLGELVFDGQYAVAPE